MTKAQGRKFGLTVGVAFLALTALLVWRERALLAAGTGTVGSLLVLAGLVVPTKLGPVERAWMAMALRISKITTPIIMGIVYYLVITPIGVIMRLVGRNPLARKTGSSLWANRSDDKVPTGGMEHQY